MKKSVYIDTTIPSYYFDERVSLQPFVVVTQKWWNDESMNFNTYVSGMVFRELEDGKFPNKDRIIDWTKQIRFLEYKTELDDIIQTYIDHFVMPKDLTGDAVHLAYASFYEMDYLLTWNCNHLANANKRNHISVINDRLGLKTPEMITPLQLFKGE